MPLSISIYQDEVYDEVAKVTDYTGSKMLDSDRGARDRILALDNDLIQMERFWDESVLTVNENFKQMLVQGSTITTYPGNGETGESRRIYFGTFETSKSFDKTGLQNSVEQTIKSFFINYITGHWFQYTNKGEAGEYFSQASECLLAAERLLYSRKRPAVPTRTKANK